MSSYPIIPTKDTLCGLRGKVVVLSGGASGIGAATTTLMFEYGANVVFGDISQQDGTALAASLSSCEGADNGTATFINCDVTKYDEIYSLFRSAFDKFGKVDHAISCAGIVDNPQSPYFDPSLSIDNVGDDIGDRRVLDVNFTGTCSFARIALPFLRHGRQSNEMENRSLTLLSSVTGFRDAPGMFLYQTSKVSILGLMRSLRCSILARDGTRVNAICPGMTESALTAAYIDLFRNATPDLPAHYQTAMDVAWHICAITLAKNMNGKSIYVEAGKGWEFEDGLAGEMKSWLGEEPTKLSDENLAFIKSLGGI